MPFEVLSELETAIAGRAVKPRINVVWLRCLMMLILLLLWFFALLLLLVEGVFGINEYLFSQFLLFLRLGDKGVVLFFDLCLDHLIDCWPCIVFKSAVGRLSLGGLRLL